MNDNLFADIAGHVVLDLAKGAIKKAADGLVAKGLLEADQRDVWVQGVVDDIQIGGKLYLAGTK